MKKVGPIRTILRARTRQSAKRAVRAEYLAIIIPEFYSETGSNRFLPLARRYTLPGDIIHFEIIEIKIINSLMKLLSTLSGKCGSKYNERRERERGEERLANFSTRNLFHENRR